MSEPNPYAPPASDEVRVAQDPKEVRAEHLDAENAVRYVAMSALAWAGFGFYLQLSRGFSGTVLGYVFLGVHASLALGGGAMLLHRRIGLAAVVPAAAAIAASPLIPYAYGDLVSRIAAAAYWILAVSLVSTKRAARVLTPDYAEIKKATPDMKVPRWAKSNIAFSVYWYCLWGYGLYWILFVED